ncbi:MAG: ester cyclase [Acidimicrobiales bacterium]
MSVRDLVGTFYRCLWNERDLAVAPTILHPDVRFRGSVGTAVQGREAVCRYVELVTTALRAYRCDVQTLVVEGEHAAAKVLFSGQHVGEFLGYAPTGARVEWIG